MTGTAEKKSCLLGPEKKKFAAFIINGKYPGKTLLVTAQIHSGEYPGTPAVIRTAKRLDPDRVHGKVIMIPCVNLSGFYRQTDAYVPEDGGNLNRDYPGKKNTVTGMIAQYFINEIFPECDFVLDLHSGGVYETLTPCAFCPEGTEEESVRVALATDIPYLVRSANRSGHCGYAAHVMGIPGLLLERGYGGQCREEWITQYERDIEAVMGALGIIEDAPQSSAEHIKADRAIYMELREDGLWYPQISAGQEIRKGQLLGYTEDLYGNRRIEYRAEEDGVVLYYHSGLFGEMEKCAVAYAVKSDMRPVKRDGGM